MPISSASLVGRIQRRIPHLSTPRFQSRPIAPTPAARYRLLVPAPLCGRRRFLASAAFGVASPPHPLLPDGTFLQLWRHHLDWPNARWLALFDTFRQLRLRRLVLQWTRYDELDFAPLLPLLFAQSGLRISLGLAATSTWWHYLDAGPASASQALAQLREAHLRQARLLAPFTRHPACAGFYLPEEFDDLHWFAAPHLLRDHLHALRPIKPLAVSAFSAGHLAPQPLAAFWRQALRGSKCQLLFQDGVGTARHTIASASANLAALDRQLHRRLTPIVELFEPASPTSFQPAPFSRVLEQCAHLRTAPLAFSVPDYADPALSPAAATLFQLWSARL